MFSSNRTSSCKRALRSLVLRPLLWAGNETTHRMILWVGLSVLCCAPSTCTLGQVTWMSVSQAREIRYTLELHFARQVAEESECRALRGERV